MSWFEVESKLRIIDYDKVKSNVKKIASFVDKKNKIDEYFALHIDGYPKKAFRIRSDDKSFVVNFKKKMKELSDSQVVVKEEFEFSINSLEEKDNFLSLCKDLGFKEWVNKKKVSETYSYNGDKRLHIELNKVARLGYWMEIEYLCDKNGVSKAKDLIKMVISLIGEGLGEIDNTGYTKMLYERNGK